MSKAGVKHLRQRHKESIAKHSGMKRAAIPPNERKDTVPTLRKSVEEEKTASPPRKKSKTREEKGNT
jgi:hypothetical protein